MKSELHTTPPNVDAHTVEMHLRLEAWLDAGTALIWRPMLDSYNFPHTSTDTLNQARQQDEFGWLVSNVDMLMALPEGYRGWLMPLSEDDSDMLCSRHGQAIRFWICTDQKGRPFTYQRDLAEPLPAGSGFPSNPSDSAHSARK